MLSKLLVLPSPSSGAISSRNVSDNSTTRSGQPEGLLRPT
jgi:hypothetical protein